MYKNIFKRSGKTILAFFISLLMTLSKEGSAQTNSVHNTIVYLSCHTTSSIVFPQLIKSVDIGTESVFAQKVIGSENVLQLKAAKENFTETNCTVITVDNKLYVFTLRYDSLPATQPLFIDSTPGLLENISRQPRTMRGIQDRHFQMCLRLQGLYIENDVLYLQLFIRNDSYLPYPIDLLRVFVRDNKQPKRTASQELELLPLGLYGNTLAVGAESQKAVVIALTSFTIPDNKKLYITLQEKNGGRHLRLKINNRKLLQARPF